MSAFDEQIAEQGDVLWTQQADLRVGPIEPLPASAQVVVVGGGYTGIAAARELARRGVEVLLLEKGALGSGASSRNAGFAHAGVRRSLPELCAQFGDVLGRELYAETMAALEHLGDVVDSVGIACDFEHHDYLYLAQRRRQASRLRSAQAGLSQAGHQAVLLGASEVREHAGTDGYAGGLLLEGAASVQPARLIQGLARDAAARGAWLSDHTPVLQLEQRAAGLQVTTTRGTVRARHVLIATDGYTDGLIPFLTPRIIPIDSFIAATEPMSPEQQAQVSPRGHLCVETKNFLCYWRLSSDGRLIFGGRASFTPTTMERATIWLRRQMQRVYPDLADVSIASVWGGKTGFSIDQLPHIGRSGDVTYAVTYCGGGVALATWFGCRCARWIDGEPAPPFSRIPFPKVPLYRGRPWFLPLVGPLLAIQDRFG